MSADKDYCRTFEQELDATRMLLEQGGRKVFLWVCGGWVTICTSAL
jgi:hypothetical protein